MRSGSSGTVSSAETAIGMSRSLVFSRGQLKQAIISLVNLNFQKGSLPQLLGFISNLIKIKRIML